MANIFKPNVTKIDPFTGNKIKTKTKKWYGRFRDENGTEQRVTLAENKTIAQQMLAAKVKQVERIKSGLVHPAEFEMNKPIADHLAGFEKRLQACNNSERYVQDSINKIQRCIKSCNWKTPAQITASDVEYFLVELRETFGCSIETSNHYLRVLKSFCRWMYLNKRLIDHPLLSLSKLNSQTDRRHDRRALSKDEFLRLIDVAETGPPVDCISGIDRAIIYLIASFTGLRKGEVGSLTKESFSFDNEECATVTVDACYSKHRRRDVLPLHPSLVDKLKEWLVTKNPQANELLFPVSQRCGGVERRTSIMMQFDLNAARTFWLAEAENPEDEAKRLASDFLQYQNQQGLFADFHCLRHTFITNLGRAKVALKTAQTLARHSTIELTANIYTHVDQQEQIDAINSLPSW
jgi:integrase